MADIRVDLKSELLNGQSVVFKAPCDCTAVTGLVAYYHNGTKVVNERFSFKDAHGNDVAGLGNLFGQGALVKVVLDTTAKAAYIQNADTNSYIEARIVDIRSTTEDVIKNSMAGDLRVKKMVGNTEQKKLSGKNLVPITATSKTVGGITFTVNSDGSIRANGKATENVIFALNASLLDYLTVGGSYILNGCPSNSGDYFLEVRTDKGSNLDNGDGVNFMVNGDLSLCALYLLVKKDITLSNVEFRPMVSLEGGEYEPYIGGVELIQGGYSWSTGTYTSASTFICSKTTIPCKSGDTIKLSCENAIGLGVVYYNNGAYVSHKLVNEGTTIEATIPTGVTDVNLNIMNQNMITPSTAGKVSLTVNGKPIYVHAGAYTGGMTSPSPYYEQPLYHTSDVVEMIQGGYDNNSGVYGAYATKICTKNRIPCKEGDVIGITRESGAIAVVYYNENGYVSYRNGAFSYTVPSGVTSFVVTFSYNENTKPSDVGKITLTINGKYVNCVKGYRGVTDLVQGYWNRDDGVSFVSSKEQIACADFFECKPNDAVSVLFNVSFTALCVIFYDKNKNYIKYEAISVNEQLGISNEIVAPTNAYYFKFYFGGKNISFDDVKIGLIINGVGETVAYFLTEKPMMLGSTLFHENGLFKVKHGWSLYTIDGDENVTLYYSTEGYFKVERYVVYGGDYASINVLCDKYLGIDRNTMRALSVNKYAVSLVGTELVFRDLDCATVEEFVAKVQANSIEILCKLATPTIEVLDTESQLALHSLETFKDVTHIEVDSRVKPKEIEVEYGATQIGVEVLELSKHKNDVQYVDVKLSENVMGYLFVAPPVGFAVDDVTIISYKHISDDYGVVINGIVGYDTTNKEAFFYAQPFTVNGDSTHFVLELKGIDMMEATCTYDGTLRVYFQRIF